MHVATEGECKICSSIVAEVFHNTQIYFTFMETTYLLTQSLFI